MGWQKRSGLEGSGRSLGLAFQVYLCQALNYPLKLGIWIKNMFRISRGVSGC